MKDTEKDFVSDFQFISFFRSSQKTSDLEIFLSVRVHPSSRGIRRGNAAIYIRHILLSFARGGYNFLPRNDPLNKLFFKLLLFINTSIGTPIYYDIPELSQHFDTCYITSESYFRLDHYPNHQVSLIRYALWAS